MDGRESCSSILTRSISSFTTETPNISLMSTSTASTNVGMAMLLPSSLDQYAALHGDQFATLKDSENQRITHNDSAVKDKEAVPAVKNPEHDHEPSTSEPFNDVDLANYNPPTALKTATNITSVILLDILQASIDNVGARIAEEVRLRQIETEATEREAEDKAARDATEAKGKTTKPRLPIIIASDGPETSAARTTESGQGLKQFTNLAGKDNAGSATEPVDPPVQRKKRSRFDLTSILQKLTAKETKPLSSMNHFRPGSNLSKTSIDMPSDENNTTVITHESRKTEDTIECVACLDDFSPKETVKVTCHSYCSGCFERLIAAAVQNEQQWPPKCCLNEIPFRTILRYVSDELGKTYKERSAEWKIPAGDRLYCNQTDCSLWIKPKHVNPGQRIARCTNGHWSCTICRGPQHKNSECPQDRDLLLTNALAEDEGWRRCARCHALVEHREACQHMTCRCGHQFCYVCGQQWKTCDCTMTQLVNLKAGASARREQRRVREAEADAELCYALRQIEEFEREEARQAEKLRQKMVKQEEERRQRELEERVRLESLRRYEIEIKYRGLRETLDQLHSLQKRMVRHQHIKEGETLSQEASTSTLGLASQQQAELLYLADATAHKLAVKEKELAREYALRVAEEKKTEDAYQRQLEHFFTGETAAVECIDRLMQDFRRNMDRGWRGWSKWRIDEMERYRFEVEEDRTIHEEVMYSIKQRHEVTLDDRKRKLAKRHSARLRWMTLVFFERARLLTEMENAELENGAESSPSLGNEAVTVAESS